MQKHGGGSKVRGGNLVCCVTGSTEHIISEKNEFTEKWIYRN